ncbi:MAG TPA: hypothetical protein VE224_10345 [Pseudolabrys sp.]|nr:hypothetical protein [Pseudolabrys sp.]
MTKSKIIAATLAAATLTGAVIGTSSPALAWHHHHHGFGPGIGIGLAIGTIAAAAAASNAYAEPAYAAPAYDCYYQKRYDRWGQRYVVKVCDGD